MDLRFWAIWVIGAVGISLFDICKHKIRNEDLAVLTLLLVAYPKSSAYLTQSQMLIDGFRFSLSNFLFYCLLYFLSRKKLGGGDVKLAIPIGIFLGFFPNGSILYASFISFFLAGIYLVLAILVRFILKRQNKGWLSQSIPIAPFLFVGATISLLS
jgi:leader peptidase (prepilin peptidase)/N-methyltransferase